MALEKAEKKKTGLIPLEDAEEMLDLLDKALERLKSMYEQYFLGVQKQAPGVLHSEVERRIRDLMQVQLRNTVHRYKFVTLQQKFGSYNSYWKRTLRQMESGTYIRQLSKIGRDAVKNGTEIPEEILAAMPKRMREQVIRDREAALALLRRRQGKSHQTGQPPTEEELLDLESMVASGELPPGHGDAPMELSEDEFADAIAQIRQPAPKDRKIGGALVLDEQDGDLDLDSFFAEVENEPEPPKVDFRAAKRPTAAPPTSSAPAGVRAAAMGGAPSVQTPRLSATPPQGVPALKPPERAKAPSQPPPDHVEGEPPAGPTKPLRRGVSRWPIAATQTGVPPGPQAPTMTPLPPKSPLAQQASQGMPILPPKSPLAQQPPGAPKPVGPVPNKTGAIPAIPKPPIPGVSANPAPIAPTNTAVGVASARTSQPMPPVKMPPAPSADLNPDTDRSAPPQQERPSRPMPAQQRPSQPNMPAQRPSQPIPVQRPSQPIPVQRPSQPSMPAQREEVVKTPPPQRQAPQRARTEQDPPRPPPGMSDADVNALYAKYVKAKEMVGENAGPGAKDKLLKTINSQAPKIMEQYKAKGVEFQIVVKDNQVIIRAKPKP